MPLSRHPIGDRHLPEDVPTADVAAYSRAMPALPDSYRWVYSSVLAEAGCITVIPASREDDTRQAFGASQDVWTVTPLSSEAFGDTEPPSSYWAWFARSGEPADADAVIEFNGFQGSRPEVIRAASKASASGRAASAFWNVNGMVVFTCARKGKVIASVDLSTIDPEDEDAGEGLPRHVKRLMRAAWKGDALEALALAMVEEFTGVRFGASVLDSGGLRTITPRPDDLDAYDADYLPAHLRDYPELADLLVVMSPEHQRLMAREAMRIAVGEAGMSGEPSIAEVVGQFDRVAVPVLGPGIGALDGAIARRTDEITLREMDSDPYGSIELYYLFQQAYAVDAVRQSTNPNPLSAALACCSDAIVAASCALLERGMTLIEDEQGGRLVDTHDPTAARKAAVVETLTAMARSDPSTWPPLLTQLPATLTPGEREAAINEDRQRRAAGEFIEYKLVSD